MPSQEQGTQRQQGPEEGRRRRAAGTVQWEQGERVPATGALFVVLTRFGGAQVLAHDQIRDEITAAINEVHSGSATPETYYYHAVYQGVGTKTGKRADICVLTGSRRRFVDVTIANERGNNADRAPLRQHPTPQGEHERMRCIASMNHSHKSKHQKYLSSVGMDASVGNRAPGLVPFVVCVGGRLHWEARRFIDELFGEHPDELRRLKMRIARIMAIFQGRVAKEARARWEEALYAACHEG